mmetsp:Transcript_24118/g.35075  ORF Transcript_24118/g.35075 Transcript_24118/m.35075 type:complete len:145 (-) Transcript_24118:621-1055(-)
MCISIIFLRGITWKETCVQEECTDTYNNHNLLVDILSKNPFVIGHTNLECNKSITSNFSNLPGCPEYTTFSREYIGLDILASAAILPKAEERVSQLPGCLLVLIGRTHDMISGVRTPIEVPFLPAIGVRIRHLWVPKMSQGFMC